MYISLDYGLVKFPCVLTDFVTKWGRYSRTVHLCPSWVEAAHSAVYTLLRGYVAVHKLEMNSFGG